MTSPYDPGRPEDRPADQPNYPSAPPSQDYGQQYPPQDYGRPPQPGQSHQGFPPAPDQQYGQQQDYGQQGGQQGGQQYGQQGGGQQQYGQQQGGQYGQQQQQPYAGGPGGYANAPAYSNQGFGTPPGGPAPSAPSDVLRAVQLMFASVALGIISSIITFTSGDAIKDSIRESDPTLTADEVNSAYNLGLGVAIFFGLVFALLYLLLAFQVRKGKNWARIVTWVLAGLGVLGGLLGLAGTGTGLEKGIGIISLLINVAIIVLLARKPANEYFAAMKRPRY